MINPTGYQLALPTTWSIRDCQWLWFSWSIADCCASEAVPQVFRWLVDKTTGSNLIICPWRCHLCSSSWAQMSCDWCGSDTWNVSCSQPSFLADYSCLAGAAAQDAGPHELPTFNLDHPATASAGAPQSVIGSQLDLRHPVSFIPLLSHSSKAGFKSLDLLTYISLGSSWNACTGQAQLTCSCLWWIMHHRR